MDVFEFNILKSTPAFWTLHYLRATGIQQLISYNMVQELLELLTESNESEHEEIPQPGKEELKMSWSGSKALENECIFKLSKKNKYFKF